MKSSCSVHPSALQHLALLLTNNCVRNNTSLEGYHRNGQLSDPDMKRLNQEIANNVYTFLDYLLNRSKVDQFVFLGTMFTLYPYKWDTPELNEKWVQIVEEYKQDECRHMLVSPQNTEILLDMIKEIKKLKVSDKRS